MIKEYYHPQDYIDAGILPIQPMTAKEQKNEEKLEDMFNSNNYIAEDKLDGTRATIHIYKDHIRIFSRRESKKTGWYFDNSNSMPHISHINLPEFEGTILDCELVMPSGEFKDIASIINCLPKEAIKRQQEQGLAIAKVFDCIYYMGESVEHLTLVERKELMKTTIKALDVPFIQEIRSFDKTRKVVIDKELKEIIYNNKLKYPTIYNSILYQEGSNNIFELNKKAYYEYYVANGGEGIILKDKQGTYRQKRGREYTKVKKFTTKDVVVIGYGEPTREYLGKYTDTWKYWENPVTKEKYNTEIDGEKEVLEILPSELEPITKFYYENWIGTIQYGVAVTEEEFQQWKKRNPKEVYDLDKIDDTYYLYMGETSGMTEEERKEFSERRDYYYGTAIEVKAHEVIKKTGKLRHPRFMRARYDKAPETCTYKDHMEG